MAEQTKNTGTTTGGTQEKPGAPNVSGTQPKTGTTGTPSHEQGGEYTPNGEAQKDAADTRRTADQSHVPTATADTMAKPTDRATDRKDNEAGDAKR